MSLTQVLTLLKYYYLHLAELFTIRCQYSLLAKKICQYSSSLFSMPSYIDQNFAISLSFLRFQFFKLVTSSTPLQNDNPICRCFPISTPITCLSHVPFQPMHGPNDTPMCHVSIPQTFLHVCNKKTKPIRGPYYYYATSSCIIR